MWRLLMLGCLTGDGLHLILDAFGISQVIMADGMELLIHFVHKGNSCRDIQIDDIGVRNAIEFLHQRTEAVPMTCDQDGLAGLHRGPNLTEPIREESCSGILQALRGWELLCRHMPVAGIMAWEPRIPHLQRRRPDIVTAPP